VLRDCEGFGPVLAASLVMTPTGLLRRRARVVAALTTALSLGACSGSPPDPPPPRTSPPGPVLHGRLIVQTGDSVVWALTSDGGSIRASKLATASRSAALSPDGRTLAYVAGTDLVFKDLASDNEQRQAVSLAGSPVPPDPGLCLNWSPDSSRVLYLDTSGALDIATPSGQVTRIDQPKEAMYADTGGVPLLIPDPGDKTYTVRSTISCASWLDPNRIVFDRVGGYMPARVLKNPDGSIPKTVAPDTTTIAVLGSPLQLVNSAGQWELAGVCGNRLLTKSHAVYGQAQTTYLLTNLMTQALTQPNGATPKGSELPDQDKQLDPTFIPGSCAVLMVDDVGSQPTFTTYRLDPGATTPVPGKPLPGVGFSGRWAPVWNPDPNPTVFADLAPYKFLRLLDVSTGGVTTLNLPDAPKATQLFAVLGWLS
jgi:hypothetical protein